MKEENTKYKNLRTGEIAEEITYKDEYGFIHKFFSPNIETENGDILVLQTKDWEKELENLPAINYNLYLSGTCKRADTGEDFTFEQALQNIKDYINTNFVPKSQVEKLKKPEIGHWECKNDKELDELEHIHIYNSAIYDVLAIICNKK